MAIYRGPGGANDGIPSSSSTEFPGDVNVAGNLHVNGDITSDGNINGIHTGDGSGLTGVVAELPTLAELGIPNHDKLTVDDLGNVTVASDITVDGVLYGDGSGLTNLPIPELPDVYNKSEIDAQQNAQDVKIDKNATDLTNVYTKTEVDDSQSAQDTEIAKKADKVDTYTKEEVDELLESASGAIVADYTNKWASSVARDPEAGNLYLVYGMTFSSKYNEVTKIYISDIDGDGEVRDFDKVKEDDKIKLSSENGSGEYTIVGISDVSGYRELIVSTDSSNGTIANDTAVSIVLDVASSGGESGGIEEAPIDGKQYGRQDAEWTEVTGGGSTPTPEDLVWEDKKAERVVNTEYTNTNNVPIYVQLYFSTSSVDTHLRFLIDGRTQGVVGNGARADQVSYLNPFYIVPSGSTYKVQQTGTVSLLNWDEARMPLAIAVGGASGGGDAQPPVAFELRLSTNTSVSSNATWLKCELDDVVTDTDSATTDGSYIIPKDGIYNISFMHGVSAEKNLNKHYAQLYVNGKIANTSVAISQTEIVNGGNHGLSGTTVREFKAGDVVELWYYVNVTTTALGVQTSTVCRLSGHMISSITEGEVKEKEAVVFRGNVSGSSPQSVTPNTFSLIELTPQSDTTNSWDNTNNNFKPSVEGYYQVNAKLADYGTAGAVAIARISKNNNSENIDGSQGNTSTVSGIFYLNGVDDNISLEGRTSTGNKIVADFSTHLITGQSSGGGSGTGGGETTPAKAPEVTVLEDGTGTYTVPSGTSYLTVEIVGGGGGAGGSGGVSGGGTGGAGTDGSNTWFGDLIAKGGGKGNGNNQGSTLGGSFEIGDAPDTFGSIGQLGTTNGAYNTASGGYTPGGVGGTSALGLIGGGGAGGRATAVAVPQGSGGSAGGYVNSLIKTPLTSYDYQIGVGGTGGVAGANGFAGNNGENGIAIVTAHFGATGSGGGSGGVPSVDTAIGMVAPFAMDSVPTGWLHCDGAEVSRDTYSLLYSKVGDTYGSGDGITTFNLPDLQDEFIRGSSDTLPVGNKQDDEFKEHDHINTAGGANGGGSYGSLAGKTTSGTTGLTGGSETRPRNVAMLYCINATAEATTRADVPSTGTPTTWVTFDGTTAEPTIIGQNNVSSVTKNGVGDYTINFTTPLAKDNYAWSGSGTSTAGATVRGVQGIASAPPTKDSLRVLNTNYVAPEDGSRVSVVITEEGSSTGGSVGETTDILPVLYSGVVNPDATVKEGVGFTCEKGTVGQYIVTLDKPLAQTSSINGTALSSSRSVGYKLEDGDSKITFYVRDIGSVNNFVDSPFAFTVTGTETIAVGGSGGGSYTPEKMVWSEDLSIEGGTGERVCNTLYTNTNDVPLYVQLYVFGATTSEYVTFEIDGNVMGGSGAGSSASTILANPLYIVPAGSTYKAVANRTTVRVPNWKEAKMPVAVGTGGKAIAFVSQGTGGELTVAPDSVYPFQDTDDGYIKDNKFIAPETGSYFFSVGIIKSATPGEVNAGFAVNGVFDGFPWGGDYTPNNLYTVSRVIHLTKGDVVEVKSRVATVVSGTSYVFMGHSAWSGFLISGSGDSVKKESGTYTPKYYGSTSMTELNITSYERQDGSYERDGQMVTVSADIGTLNSASVGTGNGSLLVTLPFTPASDLIQTAGTVGFCKRFGADNQPRSVLVSPNEAFAKPYKVDYSTQELDTRVSADLSAYNTTEYNRMIFQVTYKIAEGE